MKKLDLFEFFKTLGVDLKRAVGTYPDPSNRRQNLGSATAAVPATLIEAVAGCNGSAPAVYLGGSTAATDTIPASPKATMSARLSYSLPKAVSVFVSRASRPSP